VIHRWLVWNVLFPLQERVKGHPTFRILKEMEAADLLSPGELDELRSAKLRQFIAYTQSNVPYVRDVMRQSGIELSDIREPADLRRFPLMRKAEVRKHREQLRSSIAGKLTPSSTGGSTGEPLLFDLPPERPCWFRLPRGKGGRTSSAASIPMGRPASPPASPRRTCPSAP